ncbi:ribonuclease P protein component [Scleromatobacter humisilvae]|uniref:Ribonuclease P protein component n=1 Tax=Scleromatobacter humisilvae TaxID=2897159 RepID=A0A9X1YPI7_9BURK|nr:ribonuclease P protein component [Scleromatobacter humisilvae]MCK9688840.1 ribonuclease P protein component [Scleromatobacter humisilvae]
MTAGDLDSPLLGRIVRPADYVRVLATPMRLRSPHFAVHHLVGRPLPLKRPMGRAALAPEVSNAVDAIESTGHAPVTAKLSTELSTGRAGASETGVDDLQDSGPQALGETPMTSGGLDRWLGLVVPKRHAKRAVTRTLVKRQIRHVAAACARQLEPGLWVVRQRSPFDPKQFPSAASDALKEAARAELRALFDRAVRGERDRLKPRPAGEAALRGQSAKSKSPPPDTAEGTSCAA